MDPRLKSFKPEFNYMVIIADTEFVLRLRKWIEEAEGYFEDKLVYALQKEGAILHRKSGPADKFSMNPETH